MDGALVLDKPTGITSHSAVVAARRLLSEPRIGHLGTLDPLASGVLVLLLGRATRLARFLGNARSPTPARSDSVFPRRPMTAKVNPRPGTAVLFCLNRNCVLYSASSWEVASRNRRRIRRKRSRVSQRIGWREKDGPSLWRRCP